MTAFLLRFCSSIPGHQNTAAQIHSLYPGPSIDGFNCMRITWKIYSESVQEFPWLLRPYRWFKNSRHSSRVKVEVRPEMSTRLVRPGSYTGAHTRCLPVQHLRCVLWRHRCIKGRITFMTLTGDLWDFNRIDRWFHINQWNFFIWITTALTERKCVSWALCYKMDRCASSSPQNLVFFVSSLAGPTTALQLS